MAFAQANGVVLHYRLAGQAGLPCLVLANSLGTDARIWDDVIDRLSDRFHILSYDKRGHGLSAAPSGEYSIDDHVSDLAALLDHLEVTRLALAGISIGGIIAQRFALLHPDRLTALILCDTAPKVGDAAMWTGRIDAVTRHGIKAIAEAVMERWFTPDFRRDHPVELAGWRTMLERMPDHGYASTCAGLRDIDLREAVGGIGVPSLVVVGDQDLSTPPDLVHALADAIPGSRFEIIAGSGHVPSIDQPAALATLMRQFLEEVGHG